MKILLENAIRIAATAHAGQLDKGGDPYILHPIRVMMDCDTLDERIVAVLHDVIEDTDITADILRNEGLPEDIIKDVELLTKKKEKEEDYFSYLEKIKRSQRATKIKLLDMKDNSNILRLHTVEEKHLRMIQKYHAGIMFLKS